MKTVLLTGAAGSVGSMLRTELAGDKVRLSTRRGSVDVVVEPTPRMRAGHLSLPNGLGLAVADDAGTPQAVGILPELAYRAMPCALTFVLSKSEAFTEEMLLSFDRMLHWLRFFGCDTYQVVHVSGHAPPEDLRNLVEAANPGVLIPVHTRFPDRSNSAGT